MGGMCVRLKGMLRGQAGETCFSLFFKLLIHGVLVVGVGSLKIRKPDHLRTIGRLLHKQFLMQGRVGIGRNLQAYEYYEVVTAWYLNITRVSPKKPTKIYGCFQQKMFFFHQTYSH